MEEKYEASFFKKTIRCKLKDIKNVIVGIKNPIDNEKSSLDTNEKRMSGLDDK